MLYKLPQVKTVSRFSDFSSHLGGRSFMAMIGVAVFIHACIIIVVAMMPHNPVVKIPVRVLNFNLGNIAQAPKSEQPVPSADTESAGTAARVSVPGDSAPQPGDDPQIKNKDEVQAELEKALENKPVVETRPSSKRSSIVAPSKKAQPPAKPKTVTESVEVSRGVALNVPVTPKTYVRASPLEITQPKAANAPSGPEEIVQRYEQAISVWISRHKVYPEEAKRRRAEGNPTVRVRINRQGKVLYHVIERSSGDPFLDQALMNMVKAADPMPAVPDNYPQGEELEFLVPVSFSLKDQR